MSWSASTALWICLPLLILCALGCYLEGRSNKVIPYPKANELRPGCFSVGKDVRNV
jgi:hypothetical protein